MGTTCGPLFRLVDERVMRVGTNSYLVNTPFPLTLNCNRTTTTLHVESYAVVHVPLTCIAYNAQINILIQPKAPSIQAKDVNIEFTLPTRVLRGHDIYHKLEESNEAEELAEARRVQEEEDAEGWGLGTGYNWLVGTMAAVLSALVAGGAVCYWRRCRIRGKANQQCPPRTSVSGRLTAATAVFWTRPRPEAEDYHQCEEESQPTATRPPPQKTARLSAGPPLVPKQERGSTRGSTDSHPLGSMGDDDVFYEDNIKTPAPQRREY